MKSLTKLIAGVAVSSMLFTSCQKEPIADFELDKYEITIGESVTTENKSIDASHYAWYFNGIFATSKKNITITPTSTGSRTYTLKAYSKNEKHTDEVSKTVFVKERKETWVKTSDGGGAALAIGNLGNEKSDRVLLCDWEGSGQGSYYGTLNKGTEIIWDEIHNLPNYTLKISDATMTLYASDVSGDIKTGTYALGNWPAGRCDKTEDSLGMIK